MTRQDRMKKALLDCMEWFKSEVQYGPLTERQSETMVCLRDQCYEALGKPSVLDCDRIRRKAASDPKSSPEEEPRP